MKKILFIFAAFIALSFTSCGSKTEPIVSSNDSDSVIVDSDSVNVDSLSADSVAADSVSVVKK